MMGAKASVRHVRLSPQKVRLVIDLIRGQRVDRALSILAFSQKKSAEVITKLVKSALANASQDSGVDVDTLRIQKAYVDQGPTMKRSRPRARGRASRIRKRSSHITVVLEES